MIFQILRCCSADKGPPKTCVVWEHNLVKPLKNRRLKNQPHFQRETGKKIPERAFSFSLVLCKNLANWHIIFMTMYNNTIVHKIYAWYLLKSDLCSLLKLRISFCDKLEIKHNTVPLTFLATTQLFPLWLILKNLSGNFLLEPHFDLLMEEEVK